MLPKEVLAIAADIREMRIRGAGRIARAAAKALAIAADSYRGDLGGFRDYMREVAELLRNTRPTAVSLPNAISYVMSRLEREWGRLSGVREAKRAVIEAANKFIEYSLRATEEIGKIGSRRIVDGDVVLTHCNSMAALAVIIEAHREGKDVRVYATETRPRFQGWITARRLASEGIDVTLIPDAAVRAVMRRVDKVVVGADTVAANGAVINKIGTSMIALAAKEVNVNFYVAAETYKFSPSTALGELVEIEERSPDEVIDPRLAVGVRVRNPAFDVTPPEYINAIITEKGIIPPQAAILVLKEEFGWAIMDQLIRATADLEEAPELTSSSPP